jgi:hypothetical protein
MLPGYTLFNMLFACRLLAFVSMDALQNREIRKQGKEARTEMISCIAPVC